MLLHILCSVMFGIKYVHVSHVATSEFELTALTSSLDLQLMDGYVQGIIITTKETAKCIHCSWTGSISNTQCVKSSNKMKYTVIQYKLINSQCNIKIQKH